ncbi:uncharacterized protein isoform X2 [Leptinotarsa decemlineata]|uniref:uncharacterized protein isoform X2 n=1 Tax=Leptinotarsa decemlineata TaxID=7539 RepID=UPI000C254FBD|nr:uncharacterized protein LOC111505793 isoform X2 [Leptinotarsa decemlineata]
MDENNLYKSFNELIEENEGWILTKNEHGKVKVSSCKEDETNIYEKTRVDDGTSCIKCIISKDHLSILKEDEDSNSSIEKSASSVTMKAATMTNVSKTSLRNSVPEFSELELGSIIKIIGTIDEYDGNRYIFPKKIVKEPKGTIFHCTHLENLIQQYTETFNK